MKHTTTVDASIEVRKPIEETFASLVDVDHWNEWQSRFSEVDLTSPGPLQLGSTVRTQTEAMGKKLKTHAEVTEFMLNELIGYSGDSDATSFHSTWKLEETDDGTRIAVHLESTAKEGIVVKLVHSWFGGVFQKRLEADLEALKILMEQPNAIRDIQPN